MASTVFGYEISKMTAVMFALVTGPEWEDIEYFCDLNCALDRLKRFLPDTAFVDKYVSEDGLVLKKKGVYRLTLKGDMKYDPA